MLCVCTGSGDTANTPAAAYSFLITWLCVFPLIHNSESISCLLWHAPLHTVCYFRALTTDNYDFLSQFYSIVQIFYEEQCFWLIACNNKHSITACNQLTQHPSSISFGPVQLEQLQSVLCVMPHDCNRTLMYLFHDWLMRLVVICVLFYIYSKHNFNLNLNVLWPRCIINPTHIVWLIFSILSFWIQKENKSRKIENIQYYVSVIILNTQW